MKLYHAPRTRSVRPRWLLEELGVPYELVRLDLGQKEHKRPEYLAIHPHGTVPALVDGNLALMESSAICMYLADKFADKGLAPAPGTQERGLYYQWMVYAVATLEPPLIQIFQHTMNLPESERSPKALQEGQEKFREVARVLSDALEGKQFLVGNKFSAADIMIGSTLVWAQLMGLLGDQPTLAAYVQRLLERPACQKAQAD
ncbi:MAG: glutathione S-transferase family protein [Candidatus Binatia bacterium]|nr:glutathione S-transferase family protein [Candidatus Binatia bacterium]